MAGTDVLYIEANTGISGDMFVASMLDLGVPEDKLRQVLASVPADGFDVVVSRKEKGGVSVCDFDVRLDEKYENHDHDMDYLYGHEHGHDHEHDGHTHDHDHDGHTHGHSHDHVHRGLKEINDILDRTDMSERARALAKRIFEILGSAESKAHGVSMDKVHFHEVGAIDSIVDIVAAAVCVDEIGIDKVVISPIGEGSGTVRTMHGILSVPVPAVAHIASDNSLVIRQTPWRGEYITPTGAAIAAAIRTDDELPGSYSIKKIGVGGGKRDYDPPSMVRAMILNTQNAPDESRIVRLETDIDDSTGEVIGHVMDKLYAAGAREVHFSPIYMKKNRPGIELVVITTLDKTDELERIIFMETSTIGIRKQLMDRSVLKRREVTVETEYGELKLKEVTLPDGTTRRYPEYESLKALADKAGKSIMEIQAVATAYNK